jgi:hypothetical protein
MPYTLYNPERTIVLSQVTYLSNHNKDTCVQAATGIHIFYGIACRY